MALSRPLPTFVTVAATRQVGLLIESGLDEPHQIFIHGRIFDDAQKGQVE
ncbi:hypothetical protein ACFC0D_37280 [Streptomyces sp. NPDC056222]